jgi:hypothetical protein
MDGANRLFLERAGTMRDEAAAVSVPKPVAHKGGPRFRAVVGAADVPGRNRRIYPREEWRRAVDRANGVQIPAGQLGGAVDHMKHPGAGNLRDRCLIWHKLAMGEGGAIVGEFSIVSDHSRGRDLLAWINAGGAVGFSTIGTARTREPDAEERERYNLAPDDDVAVVHDWQLHAIDAVDNPSFSAWLLRESAGNAQPADKFAESLRQWFPAPAPAPDASEFHTLITRLMAA